MVLAKSLADEGGGGIASTPGDDGRHGDVGLVQQSPAQGDQHGVGAEQEQQAVLDLAGVALVEKMRIALQTLAVMQDRVDDGGEHQAAHRGGEPVLGDVHHEQGRSVGNEVQALAPHLLGNGENPTRQQEEAQAGGQVEQVLLKAAQHLPQQRPGGDGLPVVDAQHDHAQHRQHATGDKPHHPVVYPVGKLGRDDGRGGLHHDAQ